MTEQTDETTATIGVERAVELARDDDALLVDIRMDYEWDAGRIPGATHIEINDLVAAAEGLPRDRPIVFYCRTGSRSVMVVDAFREAGYDAYELGGGLTEWRAQGQPLDPPDGEVAPSRPI